MTSPTAYWQIVLASLIRLGKVPAARARDLLTQYRVRLQSMPTGMNRDMVYHNEPWQLALQLSGMGDEELRTRQLSKDEQQWYQKTVEKAVADAAVIGSEMELAGAGTMTAALAQSMYMTGLAPFASGGSLFNLANGILQAGLRKDGEGQTVMSTLGATSA